jgi:hypothetical protein
MSRPTDGDERYTPPEVMLPLEHVFGKLFDPCPKDHYVDGLGIPWGEKNFVNPPYSDIIGWADKAVFEVERGKFVAFLIPNDCSTLAYKVLKAASWGKWEIPFRVKFDTPDGRKVDVARSHVVFFLGGLAK